jgi:hypothetical protein
MASPATLHQLSIANKYKRLALVLLGSCCGRCKTTLLLEFHHIHGRLYNASKLSQRQRYKRYYQEALAGMLKLLCSECHKREHRQCRTTLAETHGQKPRPICCSSTQNQYPEIPD